MRVTMVVVAAVALVAAGRVPVRAQSDAAQNLAGTWTLNAWLTDSGDEIAEKIHVDLRTSSADLLNVPPDENPRDAGRRGMGGGLGGGRKASPPPRENQKPLLNPDEEKRAASLLDIVRQPPVALTISQADGTVTIADPVRGNRSFRTDGMKEEQKFESGTLDSRTRWEGPQLITDYDLGHGIALRFSYMLVPPSNILLIKVSVQLPGNAAASLVVREAYDRSTGRS